MENTEDIPQDLLSEEIHPLLRFISASRTERFLNFLIDNILMRFAMGYFTGWLIGIIGMAIAPDFMYRTFYENDKFNLFVIAYVVVIFNYVLYYTLCEKLFHGQTLGKLFTATRAIRTDGEELTFKDALLRSISRLVPFEAFSGFGDPWHDTWTNTTVVKRNKIIPG